MSRAARAAPPSTGAAVIAGAKPDEEAELAAEEAEPEAELAAEEAEPAALEASLDAFDAEEEAAPAAEESSPLTEEAAEPETDLAPAAPTAEKMVVLPVSVETALPLEEMVEVNLEVVMAELDPETELPAEPVARALRAPPAVTPTTEQAEVP